TIREATTAKSPLDHASCCRFLTASRSGVTSSVVLIGKSPLATGRHVIACRTPSKVRLPSFRHIGSAYPSSTGLYLPPSERRSRTTQRPRRRRSADGAAGGPGIDPDALRAGSVAGDADARGRRR